MLLERYDIDSLDNRDPELIRRFVRVVYEPLRRTFRAQVFGLDRIPEGAGSTTPGGSTSCPTAWATRPRTTRMSRAAHVHGVMQAALTALAAARRL